jgi:tetratricopeptide (TPR) repeat protein
MKERLPKIKFQELLGVTTVRSETLSNYLKLAKYSSDPQLKKIHRAICLALSKFERKYIDEIVNDEECLEKLSAHSRAMVFSISGEILFSLGHRDDGIKFLEKATVVKELNKPETEYYLYLKLCSYLVCIGVCENALLILNKLKDQYPDNPVYSAVYARASIAAHDFSDIDKNIQIASEKFDDNYDKSLYGLMYYEMEKYDKAAQFLNYFDHIAVTYETCVKNMYRQAVANFYSGNKNKALKVAKQIKQRMTWDKFYKISILDETSVRRCIEIDRIIEDVKPKPVLFDINRLQHYYRMIKFLAPVYINTSKVFIWTGLIILVLNIAALSFLQKPEDIFSFGAALHFNPFSFSMNLSELRWRITGIYFIGLLLANIYVEFKCNAAENNKDLAQCLELGKIFIRAATIFALVSIAMAIMSITEMTMSTGLTLAHLFYSRLMYYAGELFVVLAFIVKWVNYCARAKHYLKKDS